MCGNLMNFSEAKIVLGMPALTGFRPLTVESLLECCAHGVFKGRAVSYGCLLPQARNKIIARTFENCPDFTHLMFIDDDMCNFTPDSIGKLWSNNLDICSGLVTLRRPPFKLVHQFSDLNQQQILEMIQQRKVVQSKFTGFAFCLIKREVFEATREETTDGPVWFTSDRRDRWTFEEEVEEFIKEKEIILEAEYHRGGIDLEHLRDAIRFGQNSTRGTALVGEDITFQERIWKAGFKTFVDCSVPVGHVGEFSVDFRHVFMQLAEENKKELVTV